MQNTSRQYTRCFFSLALGGLIAAGPALAQQSISPNANGGNSSFSTSDTQTKPNDPSVSPLTAIPDDFSSLKLTAGVLMNVIVYDAPEFTTQARVDDLGNITIPLLGIIHVAGQSVAEAQIAIQDKFRSSQILTNPQVTLNVLQYAGSNVAVLGEVQSPGRFQMLAPHSLINVLAMAGGETNLAGDTIQVEGPGQAGNNARTYHYVRGGDDHQLQTVMVNPGETVRVRRAGVVYVLGAVYRPGGYVMQEDGSLNVAQAVSLAQGTLMQAKIGSIRVVRRSPDGTQTEIPVDYKAIMDGKHVPLVLEAQDIVYVPVSKIKSVFTSGANIVGEAGAASIVAVK